MKTSNAIRAKRWKDRHPDLNKKRAMDYYNRNKEEINRKRKIRRMDSSVKKYHREYMLRRQYNISTEQYNEMLKNQNFSCAICKLSETRFKKKLAVDHCHQTGKVRGLLCDMCNTAIGKLNDSIEILNSAIFYLEKANGST